MRSHRDCKPGPQPRHENLPRPYMTGLVASFLISEKMSRKFSLELPAQSESPGPARTRGVPAASSNAVPPRQVVSQPECPQKHARNADEVDARPDYPIARQHDEPTLGGKRSSARRPPITARQAAAICYTDRPRPIARAAPSPSVATFTSPGGAAEPAVPLAGVRSP